MNVTLTEEQAASLAVYLGSYIKSLEIAAATATADSNLAQILQDARNLKELLRRETTCPTNQ